MRAGRYYGLDRASNKTTAPQQSTTHSALVRASVPLGVRSTWARSGSVIMTKVLRCGDVVPGCSYEARAETENELMQKVAQHAREAHGMQTVPADVVQKVK